MPKRKRRTTKKRKTSRKGKLPRGVKRSKRTGRFTRKR